MIAIIIDEDDAVRESMRALLESYGHEVIEYASAEEYLSRPKECADCLVAHHHMPGMTGFDLIERLRTEGDRTPALVITAFKDTKTMRYAERLGVKVLEKPTVADELVAWTEEVRRAGRAQI